MEVLRLVLSSEKEVWDEAVKNEAVSPSPNVYMIVGHASRGAMLEEIEQVMRRELERKE